MVAFATINFKVNEKGLFYNKNTLFKSHKIIISKINFTAVKITDFLISRHSSCENKLLL